MINNQITLSPSASASNSLFGIYDYGSIGSVVNVFHNSILIGGTESNALNSWASFRASGSTHTARDSLLLNLRAGGTGSHFAAGSEGGGGSYTLSHNVYAGTGATAANFMDFATSATAPVSFATWQSSTGDNSSQAGIAGSGNFTSALFTSAATGHLHIVAPGTPVVVRVAEDADAAILEVADAGPGVPEADLSRIFERFERASPPGYGGLGLGLYIARQLAEAHGGTLTAVSLPGDGGRFTVRLPLAGGALRRAGA